MQYELLNPTDQYTFEASSREVALAVSGLLSGGISAGVRELGVGGEVGADDSFDTGMNAAQDFLWATGLEPEEVWGRHGEMASGFESLVAGSKPQRDTLLEVAAALALTFRDFERTARMVPVTLEVSYGNARR